MGVDMSKYDDPIIQEFRDNDGYIGGYFANMRILLLTTTGAKTGQKRVKPVAYTRDGEDYVVVASAGGGNKHPAWYHNLVAHPEVTVEVGKETFSATAHPVSDKTERRRLYDAHAAAYPTFKTYEKKTQRVIPVIILKRT
jgi:deazaflavin-dependent oxidoreductase (nitroreductase family)